MSGLAFHAAAVAAATGLWILVGLPLGGWLLRDAEKAWADGFLTEEQYQALYPERDHDDTARRLDAVARRMGTYLVATAEDMKPGGHRDPAELKAVRELTSTLRKLDRDTPFRIPADVLRTGDRHRPELDEIEALLVESPAVAWRKGLGDEWTIGLLGVRNLHCLLLLRSLLADERGMAAARDRALEASWRLGESLWRRPLLLDRLLAVGMAIDRNACLRRYRSLPPVWEERLAAGGRLALLAHSYQDEARSYSRGAQRLLGVGDLDYLPGGELPSVGAGRWTVRLISAPYVRFSVASYGQALRREAARLHDADPCGLDADAYAEEMKASQPAWNILSRIALPSLMRSAVAFRDGELDDELSGAVVRARAGVAGRKAISPQTPSAVCPALTWMTLAQGGSWVVEATGATPEVKDGVPRLRYALSGR